MARKSDTTVEVAGLNETHMSNKYHAVFVTPDELSQCVEEWFSQHELCLALTIDQVHLSVSENWTDTPDARAQLGSHREMWLSVGPISTMGRTPVEVMSGNKDRLIIQLPKRTSGILREMLIGWVATDNTAVATWKAVLSSIRKKADVFLWDISFPTGETKSSVRQRASSGAMALYKQGVALHDFFGNEFTLHPE